MYFSKLNQSCNINEDDIQRLQNLTSYTHTKYFYMRSPKFDFRKILPERYRYKFSSSMMEIQNSIGPHIDDGIKVSINFYITPSNYMTQFYEVVEDTPIYSTGPHGGKVYSTENLRRTGDFVAQKGDIWLLDVSKPHSVESLDDTLGRRVAVVVQTSRFSYDEVVDMLRESGYLS